MIAFLFLGFVVMLFGALVFARFIKFPFLNASDPESNKSEIMGIIFFIGGIILMLLFLVPLLAPMFATRGM